MNSLQAAKTAQTIVCNTQNFDIGTLYNAQLKEWLAKLPQLDTGGKRKFVLKAQVDNSFDRNFPMGPTWQSEAAKKIQFEVVVRFDHKSFDVDYLRGFVRRYGVDAATLAAFETALGRYDAEEAKEKVARKEAAREKAARKEQARPESRGSTRAGSPRKRKRSGDDTASIRGTLKRYAFVQTEAGLRWMPVALQDCY